MLSNGNKLLVRVATTTLDPVALPSGSVESLLSSTSTESLTSVSVPAPNKRGSSTVIPEPLSVNDKPIVPFFPPSAVVSSDTSVILSKATAGSSSSWDSSSSSSLTVTVAFELPSNIELASTDCTDSATSFPSSFQAVPSSSSPSSGLPRFFSVGSFTSVASSSPAFSTSTSAKSSLSLLAPSDSARLSVSFKSSSPELLLPTRALSTSASSSLMSLLPTRALSVSPSTSAKSSVSLLAPSDSARLSVSFKSSSPELLLPTRALSTSASSSPTSSLLTRALSASTTTSAMSSVSPSIVSDTARLPVSLFNSTVDTCTASSSSPAPLSSPP
mmetsp:Transcript_7022/g.15465  ORF Transcript_7022/g.15465 Transcript_7022/m.15465 type:complete len:330 (-) Transcript_7022:811-1800(-)